MNRFFYRLFIVLAPVRLPNNVSIVLTKPTQQLSSDLWANVVQKNPFPTTFTNGTILLNNRKKNYAAM